MTGYVIKLEGLATGSATQHDGKYVREYDPKRSGVDPDGVRWTHMRTTLFIAKALKFAEMRDAIAFYQQVDPKLPVRPDGRPNRPLTAYAVSIESTP